MTNRTRVIFGAITLLASLGAMPERAQAHEKWFVGETGGGLRWDLFLQPLPLALVGMVLLATLLGGILWRARGRGFLPGPEAFGATDEGRSLLYGLVPLILGIQVAVPLLVNGVQGTLFSPTTSWRAWRATSSDWRRLPSRWRSSTAG